MDLLDARVRQAVRVAVIAAITVHSASAFATGEGSHPNTTTRGVTAPPLGTAPAPTTGHHANEENAADPTDYTTPRFEPAGFPIIGGNTDIGVLGGVAATLSRFQDGVRPYFWNMDLVLAASVKQEPYGLVVAQQNYRFQWDIVGLLNGRLRLNPAIFYQRTVDQGYFGLGNASTAVVPANVLPANRGTFYQYTYTEAHAHLTSRVRVRGPFSVAANVVYRYINPCTISNPNGPQSLCAYNDSRLARDAATFNPDGTPIIRGLQELHYADLSGSIIYDTRDNEVMPRRGVLHQGTIRWVQGFPLNAAVGYVGMTLDLAQYVPIWGPFIFASHLFVDAQFGHPAFYDLYRAGTPFQQDMPGGGSGVRGVPSGRYLGPLKFVVNLEVRALLVPFHVFGQSFRLGTNVFFDTGRVWSDYTFHNPLDGTGLGLKYGVGIGGYLRWGQAALFRLEIAYSPDAYAVNPGFPFGIYVEDSVNF